MSMDKPSAGRKNAKGVFGNAVGIPLLIFFGYVFVQFGASYLLTQLGLSGIVSGLILDGVFAAILIPVIWMYRKRHPDLFKGCYDKFSVFGWLIIICVFLGVYAFGEMAGQWVYHYFPSAGITEAYSSMTSTDWILYAISALTLGPIVEEAIFRWVMFRSFRGVMGFWPAYIISAVLFAALHGTLMHIPVAIILSLFLCLIYEVTGKFRYCVIFHSVFNLLALTVLAAVPSISLAGSIVGYVIVLCALVVLYMFRDFFFGKVFHITGLVKFEEYLDNKRKRFGESKKPSDDDETELAATVIDEEKEH